MNLHALAATARIHANNLHADIANQQDRVHHINSSRLAVEAANLAAQLEALAEETAHVKDTNHTEAA